MFLEWTVAPYVV